MDLTSRDKFTTEIDSVIKELDFLNGGNESEPWEDGHERVITDIMQGNWYDGLECLLKSAMKMKKLLLHVRESSRSVNEVTDKSSTSSLSVASQEEGEEEETDEEEEETKTAEDSCQMKETVGLAKYEHDYRRRCRERNVMVFIEDYCSNSYYEEVEAALSYLDCEKEQLKEVEIVQDKTEPEDKIILRLRLNSTEAVSSILDNASKLKSYYGPRMYMAKDLTYVERQRLRKLVRILREKIEEQPENYWKIVDGQVKVVGIMRKKKVLQGKRSNVRESFEREMKEQESYISDSESEDERCALKWS